MTSFTIASNQGEMGGGEVMLLQIAEAARDLGHEVTVVGPEAPSNLCDRAADAGFEVVRIPGAAAASYLRNLRHWDRKHRRGLLWCNGLRPAFATAGRQGRVEHLHQIPTGKLQLLHFVARRGALRTVVPSQTMQRLVAGSVVLPNWSSAAPDRPRRAVADEVTVGFLGRLSRDKGVLVLVEALRILQGRAPTRYRLLLAGETRFVPPAEAAAVERSIVGLGSVVDRVGWIDRDEFFARIDLAVFPSVAPESFGLVAAEAMAARCPFVVSDSGALPEVAGHDHPWIVAQGDAEQLAEMIEKAASTPQDEMVERSYHRWLQHYSPAAGHEALSNLLGELERKGTS